MTKFIGFIIGFSLFEFLIWYSGTDIFQRGGPQAWGMLFAFYFGILFAVVFDFIWKNKL